MSFPFRVRSVKWLCKMCGVWKLHVLIWKWVTVSISGQHIPVKTFVGYFPKSNCPPYYKNRLTLMMFIDLLAIYSSVCPTVRLALSRRLCKIFKYKVFLGFNRWYMYPGLLIVDLGFSLKCPMVSVILVVCAITFSRTILD